MNRFISQKFRFYSFVCIGLLMFVHGYNLKVGYLLPNSLVAEPLTFTSYFEYFISNGLLRFRIPMLFAISGYIYAMLDYKSYGERVKKRFFTLIIPYFIWSAVGLIITYLWQQFPVTSRAVQTAAIDQLGDNRSYSDLGWLEILKRWVLFPISYQLWFLKNLFFYNLMYPFFKWVVRKYPYVWFTILFILMLFVFTFVVVDAQGMLFFSLGIWLNKTNYPIDRKPSWFSGYLFWLLFIGLVVIKSFMAFEFESHDYITFWVMMLMHFLSVIAGMIAIWYSGDIIVKWCMSKRWFIWLTSFSFFIFGFHVPLLSYTMSLAHLYVHNFPYYRIITFLLIPLFVLFICIATGALLKRLLPGVYRIATGGRGI